MIEATEENCDDHEIEEPVSPPACDPEEGPPIFFSQSIEDLAREVVDENRVLNNKRGKEKWNTSKEDVLDIDNIPRTIQFGKRKKFWFARNILEGKSY